MSEKSNERHDWSADLAQYGWTRKDVQELTKIFARKAPCPIGYATGTADYRWSRHSVDTTEVRKHLLGKQLVAPLPPKDTSCLMFDLDSKEELDKVVAGLKKRRFRLPWMAELKPIVGTGHVYIKVKPGYRSYQWERIAIALMKALGVTKKLDDVVRVHKDHGLRLPFTPGRIMLFSDGALFHMDIPADSHLCWQKFKVLKGVGMERVCKALGLAVPKKRVPITDAVHKSASSLSSITTPLLLRKSYNNGNQAEGKVSLSASAAAVSIGSSETAFVADQRPRTPIQFRSPESAVDNSKLTIEGRRFAHQWNAIMDLMRQGLSDNDIKDRLFQLFRDGGSKDALSRPEYVRSDLQRCIRQIRSRFRPRSAAVQQLAS